MPRPQAGCRRSRMRQDGGSIHPGPHNSMPQRVYDGGSAGPLLKSGDRPADELERSAGPAVTGPPAYIMIKPETPG